MPPFELSDRLRLLLVEEKHTDCSFQIDGKTLTAHKIILSAASPVFEAMFYGPMAEKRCITISDINANAFKLMLLYIYTDQIETINEPATIDDFMELYYCAEKYLIADLLGQCATLIKSSLNHSNILRALDLAVSLNINNLLTICMNFFTSYCLNNSNFVKIVLQTNLHISKECLNYILQSKINKQNVNLVYLIKEWCRIEANYLGLDKENMKMALAGIRIPEHIRKDLDDMEALSISDNTLRHSQLAWIICQRTYYKAVRPLRIDRRNGDSCFRSSLSCNRCIALKSLIINSRLAPFIRNCPFSYTENIRVDVRSGGNGNEQQLLQAEEVPQQVVYRQHFVIFNVEYNSNVYLEFEQPLLIMANALHRITLNWDEHLVGCEYPRNLFAEQANNMNDMCSLRFELEVDDRRSSAQESGSILNGLEYVILN